MVLKKSVSGIRGIFGVSLSPEYCEHAAEAFANYTDGRNVVVGTDSRASRAILKEAVGEGLKKAGCSILDLGILPTPTVAIMVKELKASGGIVITASHNPAEWNGLKFISQRGVFLTQNEADEFFKLLDRGTFERSKERGGDRKVEQPFEPHFKKIFKNIDVEAIGSRKFRVAVDCVNGAGSKMIPRLLKEMGCSVYPLNTDINLPFPHDPEPTPGNIKDLCQRVLREKADIGFAIDPDGDRVAIVSDEGEALSEELTLVLAVKHVLSKTDDRGSGIIVTNLSTTAAIDEVAEAFGAVVIRTKIGETNVVEEMMRKDALIGGEGNGGVIWPRVCHNRDSLTAIALILEYMAATGKAISALCAELPKFSIVKAKSEKLSSREETEEVMKKTKQFYAGKKMIDIDGIKVVFPDRSWVHVRASNTEPVIRIIAEARGKDAAELMIKNVAEKIDLKLQIQNK